MTPSYRGDKLIHLGRFFSSNGACYSHKIRRVLTEKRKLVSQAPTGKEASSAPALEMTSFDNSTGILGKLHQAPSMLKLG